MKKYSKLLAVTALLLVLVMMFAACDDTTATNEDTPQDDNNIQNNTQSENITLSERVNVGEITDKWSQYIEFDPMDKKTVDSLKSDSIYFADHNTSIDKIEGWLISKTRNYEEKILDTNDPEALPERIASTVELKLVSTRTGEVVKTLTSFIPELDFEGKCKGGVYGHSQYKVYSFVSVPEIENGFVITKTTKVLKESDIELDPAKAENYDYVTNYSYYDGNGNLIIQNVEEPASFRETANAHNNSGRILMDAGDKTFLITKEGDIVKSFGRNEEYDVPFFNTESNTGFPQGGYAYFSVGKYNYIVTEELPITKKVGEMLLSTTPGMSIMVMDADFNAVAEYKTNCYHVAGYAVLPNGNVYICEYEETSSKATEYDFEQGGIKFNIKHTFIDLEKDTITDLDLSFVAKSLFNNTTKDINSFINLSVMNSLSADRALMDTCRVKGDYIIATIQKYSDNKLEADTSCVVLNSSLQIVAELEKILPSQFYYPSFIDEERMLVMTKAIDGKIVNYVADLNTGYVELYHHNIANVKEIDGGYYLSGKIYSKTWKEIYDLDDSEYAFVDIINGKLYCTQDGSYRTLYAISVDNESLKKTAICEGLNMLIHSDYVSYVDAYSGQKIYTDINGTILYMERSNIEKQIEISENVYASYRGDETVTSVVKNSDGSYLVTVVTRYELIYADLTEYPSTINHTEYFIFK